MLRQRSRSNVIKSAQRLAAKQAARHLRVAKDAKSPGQVGDKLRRKMGDALADIFSEAGVKLYSDAVLKMKDGLEDILKTGIDGLEGTIRKELGNRGLGHAAELFKPWISELVEEIIHFGLEEISGGLEDIASNAAAEFSVKPEDEDDAEADLLGMGEEEQPEEVETVEEEPVAEPAADEAPTDEAVPEAPEGGTEDLLQGLDMPMPGGEAGASMRNDPYAPRTWRQRGKARMAKTTLALTPEHLVSWAGGLDVAQRKAKSLQDAVSLLQRVQAAVVKKMIARNASVAVQEVAPLELLDYASKFWAHR